MTSSDRIETKVCAAEVRQRLNLKNNRENELNNEESVEFPRHEFSQSSDDVHESTRDSLSSSLTIYDRSRYFFGAFKVCSDTPLLIGCFAAVCQVIEGIRSLQQRCTVNTANRSIAAVTANLADVAIRTQPTSSP